MSGTSGSSGFGFDRRLCMAVNSPSIVTVGRHAPFGGIFSKSIQIRPALSMFGWYTGVTNLI